MDDPEFVAKSELSPGLYDFSDVRAPIIVGVTGHRDIPKDPGTQKHLREEITRLFTELKSHYPNTPIYLLTALAEGADQLAARVALSDQVRAPILAVLPMPRATYEQDFQDEALASFRELAGKAASIVELPLVEGNSIAGISKQGHERDLQYESVGKYIVERCEILLALWDGTDNGLTGGTAAVVKFQREGIPAKDACAIEPPEGFPVCHILTPREKNPKPAGEPARWLFPSVFGSNSDEAREYYDRILAQIEKFNSHLAKPTENFREMMAKSRSYLCGGDSKAAIFAPWQRELHQYAAADALALTSQRESKNLQRALHLAVFISFGFFVAFSHHHRHFLSFLLVSLVILLGATVMHHVARREFRDTLYEDYRALAEGLRVEVFWRAAGLTDFVESYYLWKQRSELDWIRSVFRGWNARTPPASEERRAPSLEQLEQVRKLWVVDQLNYFEKASEREEHREQFWERLTTVLVSASVFGLSLVVVALWVAGALSQTGFDPHESMLLNVALVIAELLLAGGAITHHYENRMAYAEHAKQYARMALVFSRASANIEALLKKGDTAGAMQCFRKLGREALTENGDWVQLHRERPLEMPHP